MNIDILSLSEKDTLENIINSSSNIIICCHKSPDGDALGSSLAWRSVLLKQYGKNVDVIVPDGYPDFLNWLPNSQTIIRYDRHAEDADKKIKNADTIFCLDFNETSRLDLMQSAVEQSAAKKVLIDHHLAPSMACDLTVSHPDLCSTSEIIFRITYQLGVFDATDKSFATPVYCGMMTDTGSFTYNSTRPEIYLIIGLLLTKNINKDKIYRNVYNNYSSWAIRLRGYLMAQKLNVFDEIHASYFTITRGEMSDYHFIKGDAEGLVNVPLQIKGMKLSISLREDDRRPNTIWVSLRSVDDFPCNEMAERFFNGGGHLNASGGKLTCSMDEAEEIVRNAFKAYADMLSK